MNRPLPFQGRICRPFSSTLLALSIAAAATGQCIDPIAEITAITSTGNSAYGEAVALDGTVAVIGDPYADAGLNDAGIVRVYERTPAGAFVETGTLLAPTPSFQSQFGSAVAIAGDTIVVGARRDDPNGATNRGAVYVYTRDAQGSWTTPPVTLLGSNGSNNDEFGTAVAISGDWLVVGAPQPLSSSSGRGRTYVFRRTNGVWTEVQRLVPFGTLEGTGATTLYGCAVDIDGDYIVIGQKLQGPNARGSAEVLRRTASIFMVSSLLIASDGQASDQFGQSVAIDGTTRTAIVGARTNTPLPFQGAAYVFTEAPNAWTQQQKLVASDAGQQHHFGWSVAIERDTAVIGAMGHDSAYEFRRVGNTFAQHARLEAIAPNLNDQFGFAVAISGDRALVSTNSGSHATCVFGSIGSLGTNYGPLAPNSAGPGAVMAATGSGSIVANDTVLVATGCPANVTGLFVFGLGEAQQPAFDGFRLVTLPMQRINIQVLTDANGVAQLPIDLNGPWFAGLTPGTPLHFQFWYRDGAAGGTGTNFSDGLRIRFCN